MIQVMIVHASWWSNGSARSTFIDYHAPFDQGFKPADRLLRRTLAKCQAEQPRENDEMNIEYL